MFIAIAVVVAVALVLTFVAVGIGRFIKRGQMQDEFDRIDAETVYQITATPLDTKEFEDDFVEVEAPKAPKAKKPRAKSKGKRKTKKKA